MNIDKLRRICIEYDWFTRGTNYQYEKMFNRVKEGCTLNELVVMIWLCSDDNVTKKRIRQVLRPYYIK